MPANLPPQAKALERKYLEARALPEKIAALEAYISAIPDHKGTEKLKGRLRRKLAQLKRELEEERRRKVGGGRPCAVKKEGAAQVVLLGLTKSGKSALLSSLTKAKPEVTDYPYSTTEPVPGMAQYQDLQIQFVEAPAVIDENGEELSWTPKVLSLARNADAIVLVIDGLRSPQKQVSMLINKLQGAGITTQRKDVRVEVEKATTGGIQVAFYTPTGCSAEDVRRLLLNYGIRNAIVRVWGEVSLRDVEEALTSSRVYKPALIAVNKIDVDDALKTFREIRESCGRKIPVIGVSAIKKAGLEELKEAVFKSLEVVRVYTKEVNGHVASKPLVLKRGARVVDVAKIVHSQLYKNFKYAKIWGPSAKYGGERVGADHQLMDGDVVEIHTK